MCDQTMCEKKKSWMSFSIFLGLDNFFLEERERSKMFSMIFVLLIGFFAIHSDSTSLRNRNGTFFFARNRLKIALLQ